MFTQGEAIMRHRLLRATPLLLLLSATSMLGGCYIGPYPYGPPRYAYYHPYPHHYGWR